MRYSILPILLISLCLLSACGNGNDGLGRKFSKSSSASTVSGASRSMELLGQYGACQAMTVIGGTNPTYAQVFAGSQVCRGLSSPSTALLKVGTALPTNARFCLVPLSDSAFTETCFTVNGQAVIQLSTANYSSLVLLAEGDVNAYKAFLNYQTSNAPPRGIAILNTQ